MGEYCHRKAVRMKIDEEVAYEVFNVNDRWDVIEHLEKTQFEVAPTKQFFIDFNLPCSVDAVGEWGKTRPLTDNEYKKYSALFHDLINGEYPILPCMLRVVEYCWDDCDDAPDYFDETTIHDDFYNEVL
jgi:hypothetical protein